MSTDITNRPDEYGITLLCSFGEEVRTAAGEITFGPDGGFDLRLGDRKPMHFATARPAVLRLRHATNARKFREQTLHVASAAG